ncbi:hypothetical protein K1719_032247 [Acacia pycnantha]|nr:hypothetical protein K1719_046845 [Acacia pycnantha]KAI9085833.1 hypothetical protein K1719_032247 [Acacia pycnantha]
MATCETTEVRFSPNRIRSFLHAHPVRVGYLPLLHRTSIVSGWRVKAFIVPEEKSTKEGKNPSNSVILSCMVELSLILFPVAS